MKKRKLSIWLNIVIMCVCIATLAIGVYSAKNAKLATTGSVSFKAHNANVKVEGYFENVMDENFNPINKTVWSTGDNYTNDSTNWDLNKIYNIETGEGTSETREIYFDDINNEEILPLTIGFNVTNYSNFPISATITVDSIDTNNLTIYSQHNSSFIPASPDENGTAGGSDYIFIKLMPVAGVTASSTDLSLTVNFERTSAVGGSTDGTYGDFIYALKDDGSAKITGISTSSSLLTASSVNFPAYIENESKELISVSEINTGTKTGIFGQYQVSGSSYKHNTTIRSITVDNGIKTLGMRTFYVCLNLQSVDISGVESIGRMCFRVVPSLTKLDLSNLVDLPLNEGENGAFANCSALTTVYAPKLTNVGHCMFMSCTNLANVLVPNAETLSYGSLSYCEKLDKITMGNVKYIGAGAFENSKLNEIVLPESLVWLGDLAFNHVATATNKKIIIPKNVKQIGGNEYIENTSEINGGVIGSHIFYNCATSTLTEFEVAQGNTNFVTKNGALFTKDYKYMISYPAANKNTSFEIPEGCVDLFELSFSRAHFLKSITIPNTLEIRKAGNEPSNFLNKGTGSGLNLAIYAYTTIEKIIVKSDNPTYCNLDDDGCVYKAVDGGYELICVPVAKAKGAELSFSDELTSITYIPFYYINGNYTYNGITVGGMPSSIKIGANVTSIDSRSLTYINNSSWTKNVDEANTKYQISNGKIVSK